MMVTRLLGVLDLAAGLVMLWAVLTITTAAGFRSTQALWAMFRRVVYGSVAVACFGLGIYRINGIYALDGLEAMFHAVLLFGVIVFPVLRAFGWITQDQFRAVDGSSMRGSRRT